MGAVLIVVRMLRLARGVCKARGGGHKLQGVCHLLRPERTKMSCLLTIPASIMYLAGSLSRLERLHFGQSN